MKRILFLFLGIVSLFYSCKTQERIEIGQILTPQGEMLILLSNETPVHKESFIRLAKEGYWDGLTFNRVIKDFVIQGGCPDTPEGFSNSPYLLKPEFRSSLKHEYGAIGAGRDDNPEELSAGCQFYIVHDKNGIPRLDNHYTVFGRVIKGLDVLERIANLPTDSNDTPLVSTTMDVNIINLKEKVMEVYQSKIKEHADSQ